ncbi:MAG: oligosaccharide flippase family protein [Bacteroidales bacterium]
MTKKNLIFNSLSGVTQTIVTMLLTLVSVPLFINKLGFEFYGVFAILSVIGNLNLLANLGLNSSLIVYISKQGKCKESDYDIIVSLMIMFFLLCILLCTLILFEHKIIINILRIPEKYYIISIVLFRCMVIANSLLFLGQIFSAIIDAHQKIYITNFFQFIYSLFYWGGLIVVVYFNSSLKNIGIVIVLAATIWFILILIFATRLWGKLDFNGLSENIIRIAKKNALYGSKIYSAGLLSFAFEPLSKILLSNFIGVQAVAFFDVSLKIRGQITAIFGKIFQPLFPFIASQKENKELSVKLNDISSKIFLLVVPCAVLIIFTFKVLLKLWIGDNNIDDLYLFVTFMSVALLLFSPPLMPIYMFLMATNRANKCVNMQLSAVIVNAVIFFLTYKTIHMYAIVLSNVLAFATSFVLGIYYQRIYLNFSLKIEGKYFLKVIISGLSISTICYLITLIIPEKINNISIFIITIIGLSLIIIRITSLVTINDINRYFDFNFRIRYIVTKIFISGKGALKAKTK